MYPLQQLFGLVVYITYICLKGQYAALGRVMNPSKKSKLQALRISCKVTILQLTISQFLIYPLNFICLILEKFPPWKGEEVKDVKTRFTGEVSINRPLRAQTVPAFSRKPDFYVFDRVQKSRETITLL